MRKFKIIFILLVFWGMTFLSACREEHEHSYGEWDITKEATCIEEGSKVRTCECGESEIVTIEALGHTEVIDASVEATCTEDGLTEGKHCLDCGFILVHQQRIDKLGHNYDNNVCTRCDSSAFSFCLSEVEKGYEVTGYRGTDSDIIIPSMYKGLPVVGIGMAAFITIYESELTSVTIPDSVIYIERSAFSGCSSLTSVIGGNGVISIGEHAFSECSSLTSITILDSVFGISDYAFYGCSSLTSITIPDNVFGIGNNAFYGCSSLTSVIIGNNVSVIGEYAFASCSSLKNIVIPDDVTFIREHAFSSCDSLTIYCESSSRPSRWDSRWNYYNRPVYWAGEWEYDANGNPVPLS